MPVLNDICARLIHENSFSIHKAKDLSSQLCHAWFIAQSPRHTEFNQSAALLEQNSNHPVMLFIKSCLPKIEQELTGMVIPESSHPFWAMFSPEAIDCEQNTAAVREIIQTTRTISHIHKPHNLLSDVAEELLLTSNILLTIPLKNDDIERVDLDEPFKQTIRTAQNEPQKYWYDHPIPIGIPAKENELLYGLSHLDRSLSIEIERGNMAKNQKLTVVLSCSVTHPSLATIAKKYVEYEIRTHLRLRHIQVALFSEHECHAVIAATFPKASSNLKQVFGVNGAYGRHYTFLKAIAPLWQKTLNPKLKANFKIDLDQVFDQSMLIQETKKSAFELIVQSNWGADAVDNKGNGVHLGMLAGGLVNETDAHQGLFTPDVNPPNGHDYDIFEQLFCTRWPQAISTQEEILSKRNDIQRVHVTGGTNGITIDALYQYRPFTPTFIHRAEDQAFILSALANPVNDQYLVYSHRPGLIMRHDKEAFAARAMQAAEAGKVLGDIERVLFFSYYAKHHPIDLPTLKQSLYPFSGTFISQTPITLALIRFLLEGSTKCSEYLDSGALRLTQCLDYCENSLSSTLEANLKGWNEYYDNLIESKIPIDAHRVLSNCLLNLE
ncbi:hypothetical protein [Vibrio algarum]|uniref:Uncharacterized protein n=1 Tax=Vibrio algarum TaxID=3020714 RepID=A0ABT4YRJ6_9VIBR|nr:hypothetical protein [Vibrio sp. KJ40-1]MDB1124179.1 hypothetical protein [Vibrio sp. KJ40-1]